MGLKVGIVTGIGGRSVVVVVVVAKFESTSKTTEREGLGSVTNAASQTKFSKGIITLAFTGTRTGTLTLKKHTPAAHQQETGRTVFSTEEISGIPR